MTTKKIVKKLTKTMTVGGKVYNLLESYSGHSKPAWTRRDMENIASDIDILHGYDTLVVKELGGDYGIYGRPKALTANPSDRKPIEAQEQGYNRCQTSSSGLIRRVNMRNPYTGQHGDMPMTKKQRWMLHLLTGQDTRNFQMTVAEATGEIERLLEVKAKAAPEWTKEKVLRMISEARIAGSRAALAQLDKLKAKGPQWSVVDDFTGKQVGTMLDVCGFASIHLESARGKFYQIWKELAKNKTLRIFVYGRSIDIFDMTNRQELSVQEAATRAAADVLQSYGVKCWMVSRID